MNMEQLFKTLTVQDPTRMSQEQWDAISQELWDAVCALGSPESITFEMFATFKETDNVDTMEN